MSGKDTQVETRYSILFHYLLLTYLLTYITYLNSCICTTHHIFAFISTNPNLTWLPLQVHHSCFENSISTCYFGFYGVPKDKVNSVSPLLMDTLTKIGAGEMTIEMDTMKDILSNLILLQDSSLETIPHDTIANSAIGDVLYGNTTEQVSPALCFCCCTFGVVCLVDFKVN